MARSSVAGGLSALDAGYQVYFVTGACCGASRAAHHSLRRNASLFESLPQYPV
jgi:nicotinamidase-related amidase